VALAGFSIEVATAGIESAAVFCSLDILFQLFITYRAHLKRFGDSGRRPFIRLAWHRSNRGDAY
jgi:hypothetical protein